MLHSAAGRSQPSNHALHQYFGTPSEIRTGFRISDGVPKNEPRTHKHFTAARNDFALPVAHGGFFCSFFKKVSDKSLNCLDLLSLLRVEFHGASTGVKRFS